jgi:hypothetical protein
MRGSPGVTVVKVGLFNCNHEHETEHHEGGRQGETRPG